MLDRIAFRPSTIYPNISIFGRGTMGTKDNKPDNGIQGGIRFEW